MADQIIFDTEDSRERVLDPYRAPRFNMASMLTGLETGQVQHFIRAIHNHMSDLQLSETARQQWIVDRLIEHIYDHVHPQLKRRIWPGTGTRHRGPLTDGALVYSKLQEFAVDPTSADDLFVRGRLLRTMDLTVKEAGYDLQPLAFNLRYDTWITILMGRLKRTAPKSHQVFIEEHYWGSTNATSISDIDGWKHVLEDSTGLFTSSELTIIKQIVRIIKTRPIEENEGKNAGDIIQEILHTAETHYADRFRRDPDAQGQPLSFFKLRTKAAPRPNGQRSQNRPPANSTSQRAPLQSRNQSRPSRTPRQGRPESLPRNRNPGTPSRGPFSRTETCYHCLNDPLVVRSGGNANHSRNTCPFYEARTNQRNARSPNDAEYRRVVDRLTIDPRTEDRPAGTTRSGTSFRDVAASRPAAVSSPPARGGGRGPQ